MSLCRCTFVVFLVVLVLSTQFAAANSIQADIISPDNAAPGDIISFEVIVTNLAPVLLDYCNFFFSVGPYVDLIQDYYGNSIDESLHLSSLFDTLASPPPSGESSFFSVPVLGKVRSDALPGMLIRSSFQIEIISEVGPDGEWCPACWGDSATASNLTRVSESPMPAPEFPGILFPGIFLTGFATFIVLWKRKI